MKQRLRLLLPVILVAGLALAVRITYNLTVAAAYVPRFDAHSYEQIALHLLQERCFCKHPFVPTVYRTPLWLAIISCIYALFGPQKLPIRLLLALVVTALYRRRRLGLLAGL